MPFDHFSMIAPIYARLGEFGDLKTLQRLADLPATGRLLDLGGGTGRVSRSLVNHVGMAVIADVSTGMLRHAGKIPGLLPLGTPSEKLPFAAESFARVIMVDALHHVADQQITANEIWRVLIKGGRAVIVEPDIRVFGVKLIALMEKALLMRSHFLGPEPIRKLFPPGSAEIHARDGNIWVVVRK
jgi:demethylmenaquinone methyltransferase/2-methoxy-6-polyprenyl-1,4-benzoquinol methylase